MKKGKAIAKQRDDFREGRPNKFSKKQVKHALWLLDTHSYTQVEEITGISKSTLYGRRENRRQNELSFLCSYIHQSPYKVDSILINRLAKNEKGSLKIYDIPFRILFKT